MLLLAKSTGGSGGGGVQSVVGGKNITIDNTDSKNPIVNSLADRYKTSSTTSNTIVSHGTLTFTVDADLAYIPNQDIIISFDATNYMTGHVESYNETTGELVAHIAHKTGSGTYSSWLIGLDAIKAELPEWGDISGTLSDQTDLQTALDGKVSKSGDSMTGDLTVGTDVFHVDTSNNRVGIGTDSPNVTQHIYGAETILGVDGVALEVADSTGNALNNGGAMVFTANTTRVAGIKGIKEVETGSRGGLGLYTRDGSDLLERVRINKDGNVGINTTSPAQKLDVNGQAVFGNTATRLTTYSDSTYSGIHNGSSLASDESIYMGNGGIFFLTNTANRMVINGDGDVGIGTNNPKSRLSLIDADSGLTHEKTDGGYFYSTGFLLNNPYLTYYGSSGMSLGYGGITGSSPSVNTMFLSNTGDVEVSNDLTVGSDSMYVDSANGRVGINELSPIAPLHVQQSSNDEGIRLYGYDTNSDKYLQIRINQYGSLQMAGTVSVFNFNTVDPKVADNKGMRFGNDNDYIVGYNSADDSLKIGTGSSTSASNGVSIENDGKVKVQDLQIDTSTAPETGQVWTATDTDGNGEWGTPSGGGGNKTVFLNGENAGLSGTGLSKGTIAYPFGAGVLFADGYSVQRAIINWTTPSDFTSIESVEACWFCFSTGNAYLQFESSAMGGGEFYYSAPKVTMATTTYASLASGGLVKTDVTAMTSGLAISSGDIVGFTIRRDGGDGNDTLNNTMYFMGFIVTYT